MTKAAQVALLFAVSALTARAQWVAQSSGTEVRLRGVSAVRARVAWASGDKGTYARTTDGGRTWRSAQVPGAEALDFRDVDAFDADTAYLLSIGEGDKSRIYKTTDGGHNWALQFWNTRPAAFFDCMAFWDKRHGVAVSDPVGGKFVVITTTDGGRHWVETPPAGVPPALEGEGAFAASGTCVAVSGKSNAWFGTGGPDGARVFHSKDGGRTWEVSATPLAYGKAAGVFSVAFRDALVGVIVGGNYTKEREASGNVAVTSDGGKMWETPKDARPGGYRSCVAVIHGARGPALVAVGPSGSDYSSDGGKTWQPLSAEGFHAASFSSDGRAGWAVGEGGRIAKYGPR